ncbi:MAG: nucleotidyltransferase family protein [Alistipes sp.]|nr:nucleotidyltransferase family protein [Alistipes sp.]
MDKKSKELYTNLLFVTLRSALLEGEVDVSNYKVLKEHEWQQFYALSAKHGVLAIVYEVLSKLPSDAHPPRKLKLQWALRTETIINRSRRQEATIKSLASLMDNINVQFTVLKGISFASYYPNPLLRECGDCDAYMFGEHIRAEKFLQSQGINLQKEDYKHSHFRYKGLLIENHRYCTKVRDGKKAVIYEQEMCRYLNDKSRRRYISEDSKILLPCDEFNILMFLRHASVHFLTEGLTLRHLCDWFMILNKAVNNVNWNELKVVLSMQKLERFAYVLTTVADKAFGSDFHYLFGNRCNSWVVDKVIDDLIYGFKPLYSTASSGLMERIGIVKYSITHAWKYHHVMQTSVLLCITSSLYGILLKKYID